jgi:hypothetical protein
MFKLRKKRRKFSVKVFAMIVLQPQKCWRLDYETRIEYCTFDLEDRDLDYETRAANCILCIWR